MTEQVRGAVLACLNCGKLITVFEGYSEQVTCNGCKARFYVHSADSEDEDGGACWLYLSNTEDGEDA